MARRRRAACWSFRGSGWNNWPPAVRESAAKRVYAESMKAYLITTCTVFGLITVAHIWRAIAEGPHLAKEPWFILLTLLGVALFFWGAHLLRRWPRA